MDVNTIDFIALISSEAAFVGDQTELVTVRRQEVRERYAKIQLMLDGETEDSAGCVAALWN